MSANLLKQAFARDIAQDLWPANPFLEHSIDDSPFIDNEQVNLPHVGTAPGVVKDRTSKGSATKRADAASQYPMHELSSDPTWIQYSEELLVNYNKRQSVLTQHKNSLQDALAVYVILAWALGGDSEGASVPEKIATSGTGSRSDSLGNSNSVNQLAYVDVLNVISTFNKQNIPQNGRYALITPDMLRDLMQIDEFKNSDYNINKPVSNAPDSFNWLGMRWYVRNGVLGYDNVTPAFTAHDDASAVTGGAIFWHRDFVRKAKGSVKTFLNVDDAELYGSKLSALVRYGAFGARNDCKGIVNLYEETTA